MKPRESLAYFQSRQDPMLEELIHLVELESPTTHKLMVDRLSQELAVKLSDIGMTIEFHPQSVRGNHLIARWGAANGPKILLIGHLDTVWEPGTIERMPVRIEGDTASGPGIFDMKGGIVIAIYALRLLREHGMHHSNLTLLLTSDEEEGSETSRELIEREARNARCALVLEPGGPNNSLKTKRRGTGRFKLYTHGRSAHAGVEPEKGINAIVELARQILEVQQWNDLRKSISVHVTMVQGGTRTNVIPALAHCLIDVRCDSKEDIAWLQEHFSNLRPKSSEVVLEVKGGIGRPPLERTDAVINLFRRAEEIGRAFDYSLTEYFTGGASDGNFTAALGVPTIDGLGPEGAGAHATSEHIIVSSLPRRTNLLYHLLLSHMHELKSSLNSQPPGA